MTWMLQCPDGQSTTLGLEGAVVAGAGEACGLRLNGPGVPEQLAELSRRGNDAWLCVLEHDPPVGVNGRPVRALARVLPGDRVCFGAFCVDVLGESLADRVRDKPVESFLLRVRGGAGSGALFHGPTLHLDEDGEIVSAAAGKVSLTLTRDGIRLETGAVPVRVNGHLVPLSAHVAADDQIQIGARRYLVEALTAASSEAVTQRLQAISDEETPEMRIERSDHGGLWWLMGISAVLAALIAALLYFHG